MKFKVIKMLRKKKKQIKFFKVRLKREPRHQAAGDAGHTQCQRGRRSAAQPFILVLPPPLSLPHRPKAQPFPSPTPTPTPQHGLDQQSPAQNIPPGRLIPSGAAWGEVRV